MINTTQTLHDAIDQGQLVIRALSSITSEQASAIAAVVRASSKLWDVHAVDDYDGYLSLLIESAIIGDDQKAIFISGTMRRIEMARIQDDHLQSIGTFTDAEALGAQLTELLDTF